jgi:hypothetical protein
MRESVIARLTFSLAIAVALFLAAPISVHRYGYDHAYVEWRRNPTPANQAALQLQLQENRTVAQIGKAACSAALFILFNTIWFAVESRAARRKRSLVADSK